MTYNHMEDGELVAFALQKDDLTELELELTQRVEQLLDYIDATDEEIGLMIEAAVREGTPESVLRCLKTIHDMVTAREPETVYVQ